MPDLPHIIRRADYADEVGRVRLPGLFLRIYVTRGPGRNAVGWIAAAPSPQEAADAPLACVGWICRSSGACGSDDPVRNRPEEIRRCITEVASALLAVDRAWAACTPEIFEAARLFLESVLCSTTSPDQWGECIALFRELAGVGRTR